MIFQREIQKNAASIFKLVSEKERNSCPAHFLIFSFSVLSFLKKKREIKKRSRRNFHGNAFV